MKVILYIGHHKVGSTALQLFLTRNWLRLMRNGILYPMVESEGTAFMLEAALRGEEHTGPLPINVREPHNTLAFRMLAKGPKRQIPAYLGPVPGLPQMKQALLNQMDRLKPHTVVLCSEVMSNFGARPENLIGELKDQFPGAEFEIYCTLRRPDEYLVSWYGQRLRFGHKVEALGTHGIEPYRKGIHFDYQRLLEPWTARFPDARFHVRNYDDVLAAGGSCEDFLEQVSLNFPKGMKPVPRANESLATPFMEISRRGNHTLPGEQARELFRFLLRADLPAGVRSKRDIEMFGAANRDAMAGAFAPIHDFLGTATGAAPFFPDIDRLRQTRPIPEAEAMRIALADILKTRSGRRPSAPVWTFLETLAAEQAA